MLDFVSARLLGTNRREHRGEFSTSGERFGHSRFPREHEQR